MFIKSKECLCDLCDAIRPLDCAHPRSVDDDDDAQANRSADSSGEPLIRLNSAAENAKFNDKYKLCTRKHTYFILLRTHREHILLIGSAI